MQFLINSLIVFRLTRLIRDESAPFDIMGKFRDSIGLEYNPYGHLYGSNEFSRMIACPHCLGLWIALIVTKGNIRQALALSGAASLLYRWFDLQ